MYIYSMVYNFIRAGMGMANSTSFMANRRRKFNKKYPRISKYSGILGKVTGLNREVNFIKGIVNAERHFTDVDAGASPDTGGTVILISPIGNGTDNNQRIGLSVLGNYLRIEGSWKLNPEGTNPTVMRTIIFCDTSNQGVTPDPSDLLEIVDVNGPKNVINQKRFSVLRDIKVGLSPNGNEVVNKKIYIKTRWHVKFSGDLSTDTKENNIYILHISDQTTNLPTVSMYTRFAFYDN